MRRITGKILILMLTVMGLHSSAQSQKNAPASSQASGQIPPELAVCDSLSDLIETISRNAGSEPEVQILADLLIEEAGKVGSLKYMGRGYYAKSRTIGVGENRQEALQLMHTAARLLEAGQDSSYLPKALYSTAAIEYLVEDLESAQRDAVKAIAAAEASHDTTVFMVSVNIVALIQKELGNYQAAIDYLEPNLERVGTRGKYYLMQNLGVIYKEMGEWEKAKSSFSQVAIYYEKIGLTSELALTLNNLGTVSLRTNDPQKALDYLEKALNLAGDRASPRMKGLIRMNRGVAYRDLGNCRLAVKDFEVAKKILGQVNERKNLAVALENEAECRFQLGQAELAYQLLDSAKVIGDSLADISRTESIAELEQKYRQESQKQRIEDLKKENAIVLERNDAIAESVRNQRITLVLLLVVIGMLAILGIVLFRLQRIRYKRRTESDKQLLLRQQIKPHFIFNAMNSIQHFLVHDRKKEGLIYLGKFGELLRSILKNSENDLVSIAEELKLIRYYLDMEQVRTNDKFDYEVKVEPGIEVEELYMPGMILQMLVENAIWHGVAQKEGRGLIEVRVRKSNGKVEVVVRDDGVGLFYNRPGKNLPRKSFGLDLVRQRIKRLSWNKVSFLFSLEEEKDSAGATRGTLARIIIQGKSSN